MSESEKSSRSSSRSSKKSHSSSSSRSSDEEAIAGQEDPELKEIEHRTFQESPKSPEQIAGSIQSISLKSNVNNSQATIENDVAKPTKSRSSSSSSSSEEEAITVREVKPAIKEVEKRASQESLIRSFSDKNAADKSQAMTEDFESKVIENIEGLSEFQPPLESTTQLQDEKQNTVTDSKSSLSSSESSASEKSYRLDENSETDVVERDNYNTPRQNILSQDDQSLEYAQVASISEENQYNAANNDKNTPKTFDLEKSASRLSNQSIISTESKSNKKTQNEAKIEDIDQISSHSSHVSSHLKRKSSLPALINSESKSSLKTESVVEQTASIASDSSTKLPILVAADIQDQAPRTKSEVSAESIEKMLLGQLDSQDLEASNKKSEVTEESIEKLLLGSQSSPKDEPLHNEPLVATEREPVNNKQPESIENEIKRPDSASSTSSASSKASIRSGASSKKSAASKSASQHSRSSSRSSVTLPDVSQQEADKPESPQPTILPHRPPSNVSENSSIHSEIGELNSLQFGQKRYRRPVRPKTPNSLKEYARKESRESMAAAVFQNSRRSTVTSIPISLSSRSRLAGDVGNMAPDAFIDDMEHEVVVPSRRLSSTVKQVLLGMHLPEHLKARHQAGMFLSGVVSFS